jgi:mannose-6-phosphate isomerase-like protein (cupin superfamily)
MSQDALDRWDLGARASPRRGNLAADVAAYAANPLFDNVDEWIIAGNPYRRPVRPQDLADFDFAAPLDKADFCSGSALAAQRMMINIYESDAMFLPAGDLRPVEADFRRFYHPETRRLGDAIRPHLEHHAFAFLDREIDTSGTWTTDDMVAFFDWRLKTVAESDSAVKQAVLEASNPEEAATSFLIQPASDFLTEASAMARNILGNFGPIQSALFKILIDEYGYGVHQTKHSTLYQETLESRGLSPEIHAYWQFYLASSLALTNYFHYVSRNHELFFRYLGALYYTEASLVYATRHQSDMLKAVWGDDVDTLYFDEHTHIDKHHGRMVIEQIITPLVEQCGEAIIPDVVRGFEEFRTLQDMADADLIKQIAWSDGRHGAREAAAAPDINPSSGAHQPLVFHEDEGELSTTHVHEHDELFAIEDGAIDLVYGLDQTLRLEAGEAAVIPRHRLHGSLVVSPHCTYHVNAISE